MQTMTKVLTQLPVSMKKRLGAMKIQGATGERVYHSGETQKERSVGR